MVSKRFQDAEAAEACDMWRQRGPHDVHDHVTSVLPALEIRPLPACGTSPRAPRAYNMQHGAQRWHMRDATSHCGERGEPWVCHQLNQLNQLLRHKLLNFFNIFNGFKPVQCTLPTTSTTLLLQCSSGDSLSFQCWIPCQNFTDQDH